MAAGAVTAMVLAAAGAVAAVSAGGRSPIAAPAESIQVGSDSFQRDVPTGLGSADRGGKYTISANAGVQSKVQDGTARIMGLGAGKSYHARLVGAQAGDTLAGIVLTVPQNAGDGAGLYYGLDMRAQGSGATYRTMVTIANNTVQLLISRFGPGLDRTLATVKTDVAAMPGSQLVLEGQVLGNAAPKLSARVWVNGSATPSWQLMHTDSSSDKITSAGSGGIWAYESSRGVAASAIAQTNFQLWSLAAASNSPSPRATSAPVTPVPTSSQPYALSSSAAPSASATTGSSSSVAPPASSSVASSSDSAPSAPASGASTGGHAAPPSRGASPVGSAEYEVPSNALFVSPSGSDANAGTIGSPVRSLTMALSKARSGQSIVLRAGIYHASLVIPKEKPGITVQAYPREAVWFDGSTPVTGWVRSGKTWVHSAWGVQFDHSASFTLGTSSSKFIGTQNPMAAWPDGVWIDGQELTQVGSADQVTAGTFYVNYDSNQLLIGDDPTGREVRATELAQAFKVLAPNVTLEGFGVRRYATSLPLLGSVRFQANNDTARDLVVTDNATQGLSFISGSGGLVDHVTSSGNGLTGVHGNQADGLTVRDSVLSGNNAQHFNTSPSAAGIKVTRSRGITFENDLFSDNQANGLWLDQSDVGFTMANNTFSGNYIGSQIELADNGIIANNVYQGGMYNLYLLGSGDIQIFNNSFAGATTGSLWMWQDARRQKSPDDYNVDGDKRYPLGDPTDPWLLRNVTIDNNVFSSPATTARFQIFALDKATNIPADRMNLTINGNRFAPQLPGSQTSMVGWGQADNRTLVGYGTPAALSAAKNSGWRNVQASSIAPASIQAGTTVDPLAVPLPSGVADVVNQPVGAQHLGPF